jgi:xylan 1,4-beta-xylosidase
VNDVYTDYLGMNKPNQLTLQQVNNLKQKNKGAPIATEKVTIDSKGIYSKDFNINENDVLLLTFVKQ